MLPSNAKLCVKSQDWLTSTHATQSVFTGPSWQARTFRVTATATFAYDGDGQRVKATVNGATTAYVGNHYEVNLTTGATTSYYYAGSTRVAMRQADVVSYLPEQILRSDDSALRDLGVRERSNLALSI